LFTYTPAQYHCVYWSPFAEGSLFDAIVCDPPYGIRAGAKHVVKTQHDLDGGNPNNRVQKTTSWKNRSQQGNIGGSSANKGLDFGALALALEALRAHNSNSSDSDSDSKYDPQTHCPQAQQWDLVDLNGILLRCANDWLVVGGKLGIFVVNFLTGSVGGCVTQNSLSLSLSLVVCVGSVLDSDKAGRFRDVQRGGRDCAARLCILGQFPARSNADA
jgi:hypothetical protein